MKGKGVAALFSGADSRRMSDMTALEKQYLFGILKDEGLTAAIDINFEVDLLILKHAGVISFMGMQKIVFYLQSIDVHLSPR